MAVGSAKQVGVAGGKQEMTPADGGMGQAGGGAGERVTRAKQGVALDIGGRDRYGVAQARHERVVTGDRQEATPDKGVSQNRG